MDDSKKVLASLYVLLGGTLKVLMIVLLLPLVVVLLVVCHLVGALPDLGIRR